MNIADSLSEKKILITGASSGIGKAIAEYLSEMGANVVLVSRDKQKLEEIVNRLPNKAYYYPFDLKRLDDIEDIFKYLKSEDIKLDGFVHSAGLLKGLPLKVNDIELMQEIMTVNYYSFVELMKYFSLRKYSNNSASAVAISSVTPLRAEKGRLIYTASKGAINSSVGVMAKELAGRNIRVNAVLSAFVETEGYKKESATIDVSSVIEQSQPLGFIDPKYIAYLVGYLLSDYSKYMTGLGIPIDAGYLL